ncbi:hemolysin family protein [Rhizorhabdus dicambivorans]|uniref:HlyC/CorC family transporter n=1 Tax=Rhizorhabdus dicambivorans TaxID=1850238 RepID=A0A2A4FS41_9SPHN|nr:hemolysin family protein [Rhizorhabdus dicambivorans]ATE67005.1 HlyC/CorC family transporter [Rhizorhabdus dicambivorans]PCE40514.1 HlyC/CorC family transporter [Rhizorhabdus dicambivorans]
MPDDSSSSAADSGGRWWRGLRALFAPEQEPSLRDQIEEAIEEHDAEGGEDDDLSTAEREMLRNILHFDERNVGDIGVPRGDIIAVPETIGFDDLVARFAEAEHSRLPVYGEDLDHVVGMVHVKDVFRIIATGAPKPETIAGLIRQPRYVPSSMRIIDLLAEMRETRTHLAIVLNEYSGTDGLVTIEDLVEEIVGDIEDEHDEEEEDLLIPLGDAIWSADARAELEDVARLIDPRLADIEDDVETLGGLASALAGQVPQTGQILAHPSGWRLEIADADERRVKKLLLHPPAVADEAEGE